MPPVSTLRVRVVNPADDDSPLDWAIYDAAGACTGNGSDPPSRLPAAERIEVVVAASEVRLASVALPPLPAQRLAGAAAYALEDRLAGALDEHWLAASPQRRDGRVTVAIVERAWLASLRERMERAPWSRIARVITEPDLAAIGPGIRWCVPDAPALGDGFVRLADGSAFAVTRPGTDAELPAELALAIAQAVRDGTPAPTVHVDATVGDDTLARWQQASGASFVRGTPWRWAAAPATAFAAAIDLLHGEFALAGTPQQASPLRRFAPALWLAGAALALHVAASAGEWGWWRVEAWRTEAAWRSLAAGAGLAPAGGDSPAAIRAALLKRYAAERHARGQTAPTDALPLLARVAPALAGLPPGTLKSATYADGHWTLDLRPVDATVLRELDARMRRAGASAIAATTQAGTRLRVGLAG